MSDSYFTLLEEAPGLTRVAASEHTVGPWAPGLQHGGPPSSLAVAIAERAVRNETGRTDLTARRLAADFVGAVPVGTLTVRTRLVRAARSAALVEAVIAADDRNCYVARVWFVRDSDTSDIATPLVAPAPVPDGAPGMDFSFGYGDSLDWRFVSGALSTPGPGIAWARPRLPLVAGWDYSGLARTVLVADSSSGVSAELDWQRWSFVNVDLDVHLVRPVEGEWVLLDALTQLGPSGSALARSTISDVRGVIGSGLQTLVLVAIPTE